MLDILQKIYKNILVRLVFLILFLAAVLNFSGGRFVFVRAYNNQVNVFPENFKIEQDEGAYAWKRVENLFYQDLGNFSEFGDFNIDNSAYIVYKTALNEAPGSNSDNAGENKGTIETNQAVEPEDKEVEESLVDEEEAPIDEPRDNSKPEQAPAEAKGSAEENIFDIDVFKVEGADEPGKNIEDNVEYLNEDKAGESKPENEEMSVLKRAQAKLTKWSQYIEEDILSNFYTTLVKASEIATNAEDNLGIGAEALKQSIYLSDFSIPPQYKKNEIGDVNLRASLAAISEFKDDKLLIEYMVNGIWKNLGEINFPDYVSNHLNKDYMQFSFPDILGWEDIDKLELRISYTNREIDNEDLKEIGLYIDAIWLEISYNTFDDDVMNKDISLEQGEILGIKEKATKANKEENSQVEINLISRKIDFRSQEKPEFNFLYKKKKSFIKKIFSTIIKPFYDEYKDIGIEANISGPLGEETDIKPNIRYLEEGEFEIVLPEKPRSLKPGKYIMEVLVEEDGKIFSEKQAFVWGVLAVNTNKTEYLPGEQAFLQIAVLDDIGHTICDAELELAIVSPDGVVSRLKTADGSIQYNPKCGPDNVMDTPDYYAYFQTSVIGEYRLKLSAITKNGLREIDDIFYVNENIPFEIERRGPTRIYPQAIYGMDIMVKVNEDYSGYFAEKIPSAFKIMYAQNAQVQAKDGFKEIIWQKDWKKGKTYHLRYTFDAPNVSPELYFLGPAEIADYEEKRAWQIASDVDVQVLLQESISVDSGTTDTSGWTDVVSISSSSFTAGNTYFIYATAGFVGSTASVNTDFQIVYGSNTEYLGFVEAPNETAYQAFPISWFDVYTQPGSAETIKLQYRTNSGTSYALNAQILAINLNDLSADDWRYAENTTQTQHTASMVDRTSVTLDTADGAKDWLVMGMEEVQVDATNRSYEGAIYDGTSQYMTHLMEGENTDELVPYVVFAPFDDVALNQTFYFRTRDDQVGVNDHLKSRIFALNLDAFESHKTYYADISTALAATPTWTEVGNLNTGSNYQPTSEGDQVIFASFINDAASASAGTDSRLQVNGSTVPTNWSWVQSPVPEMTCRDSDDEHINNIIAKTNIPTSGYSIDLDGTEINQNSQVADEVSMTVFSVAKPTPLTVSPDDQTENDDTSILNNSWTNESTVKLKASAVTGMGSTNINFYFELVANTASFTTATSEPSSSCPSGISFASCSNKIWKISASTTAGIASGTVSVISIPESSSGYKWQVIAFDESGYTSEWREFNSTKPNFKVDTTAPTAPGALTAGAITGTTIVLNFGATSTESFFEEYKIFYKQGASGVTESDTQHSDANLSYIDYNGETDTLVADLNPNLQYVFNIWAYDQSGQKASSTELVISTQAALSISANNQYKSDVFTEIAIGDWTDENEVNLSSIVGDTSTTTTGFNYYFELLDENGTFTTATTAPASPCANGTAYGSCGSKIWTMSASTTFWYDANWGYRKKITINANQVSTTTDSFVVLATTTDIKLAHTSNGGHMASSTGADLIVVDFDGVTVLDYEREYYSSSTGEVVLWIETDISSATNKVLYLYYGNASIGSDQQNPTGVWGASYAAVHHMNSDPGPGGAGDILDSTANNNDATADGSMTSGDLVSGKAGPAIDFDGSNDNLTIANSASLAGTTGAGQSSSWSYWIYFNNITEGKFITHKSNNANPKGLWSELHATPNRIRGGVAETGGLVSDSALTNSTWYHVYFTHDGTNSNLYINGLLDDGPNAQTADADNNFALFLMGYGSGFTYGKMDEFKLSNQARTSGWIETEYNNQSDVNSFLSISGEESISAMSYEGVVNISSIPDRGSGSAGYKWQTFACNNKNECSEWDIFDAATPNFKVDTQAPTAPGNLTLSTTTPTTITLLFGATTTEANFADYKIFYKKGISEVDTNDIEWDDANLDYIDYHGATTTIITGLESYTQYVFNIWAYDQAGNKTSATEISVTTAQAPHARARSVMFLAGDATGNGETGDSTDTNLNFSAFNFKLAEEEVEIRNAYILLEVQFESYHNNSSDYTGYNIAFDACEEPCSASAFSGSGRVLDDDNTTLAYDETASNQIRLLMDVSNEPQLSGYNGFGTSMEGQVGYRIETGSATTSISYSKAILVVTYAYNSDDTTSYTNTVIYPLESQESGDSGSRRLNQADDCTKTVDCPKFNYNVQAPELSEELSQWFELYSMNSGHDANDVNIDVNISGTDSDIFVHESANGGAQGRMPMVVFDQVFGYADNTSQALEVHAQSDGAASYALIGGEVVQTYLASNTAPTKTRTVSFPLGILSNGQAVSTASASVNVYFPENGGGSGIVDIKKAWFRVIGSNYVTSTSTITINSQVGNNSPSSNYIYNMVASDIAINPTYKLIHVIPSADYSELESANSSNAKEVILNTTNSSVNLGGVSAELLITYTYTDESNGYLASLNLFGAQSADHSNSLEINDSAGQSVFPELRGTETVRAAALLSNYLITDNDGDVPAAWFTLGSNIAASSPTCTEAYSHRVDGVNSFAEYYFDVTASIDSTDRKSYSTCVSNNNISDVSAGAKMSTIWLYTYQWDAPPPTLTQDDWRWYNNIDAIQPTTPKASENTSITGINIGDILRLRININVTSENLTALTQSFKLQFGKGSDCTILSSWSDIGNIGGTSAWIGYNNPDPADGAALSSVLLASSTVLETYEEQNNSASNPNTVPSGGRGEWDWVIYNKAASSSANYCFRMVKSTGSELDDYFSDSYPKLTTAAGNTAPNTPTALGQYRADGVTVIPNLNWINEDTVKLRAAATDPNVNEQITLYFELISNAGSFSTATSVPGSPCSSGTSYAGCASKVWIATSTSGDYRTVPFNGSTTIITLPDNSNGYKWQVMACDDSGVCSAWAKPGTPPNFKVDTTPPTPPGNLIFSTSTPTSITLFFGASTTESNFEEYRIYYKVGASGVTEGDINHLDSNLDYQDFNSAATTTINDLSAGMQYVFNIWAYDKAGNKASATIAAVGTTTSAFNPPTGSWEAVYPQNQKSDGSGRVDLTIVVNDPDNDDTLRAKIQYKEGTSCDFSTSSDPTLDENSAYITATYGYPDIDNNSEYQVGTSTSWILSSPGENIVQFDWLSKLDIPNANGPYCVKVIVNDGMYDQVATATDVITIDNIAPTPPGQLATSSVHYTSILFDYGAASFDLRFDQYKIFYREGIGGVTESDTQHIDSNMDNMNYSGATSTLITGLTPNTDYVFNIWAYDNMGNVASATEITVKTNAKPTNISADNQYRSDFITSVINGSWIDEDQIALKASVHDQDNSDFISFYYELLTATSTFSIATTVPASSCATTTGWELCSGKIWKVSTTSSELPADWYHEDWPYRKQVTINAGKVLADISNFPVLATTTDSDLAGKARADGYDIVFTDSGGTTTVPYEREYFNSTTGKLSAWIRTDISSTTDTVLYMYYGNEGASVDNATTSGVWDSGFRGVWHLSENVIDESTASNAHLDSTIYNNHGDQYGNNESTAWIYQGQDFDGLNDYIEVSDDSSLDINDAIVIDFWLNGNVLAQTATKTVYTTAGIDTFTVPAGVTEITVKAWGAGGGGGGGADVDNEGGAGGGGAFAQATIAVVPGEVLDLHTGGGGGGGTTRGNASDGGGGGGRSSISRTGTSLIVAGAGSGGGGASDQSGSAGGRGGAGGALVGNPGEAAGSASGGGGGTQSTGGSAGSGANTAQAGASLAGGDGADGRCAEGIDGSAANAGTSNGGDGGQGQIVNRCAGGGGGGSGYYGGGGGGQTGNSPNAGAGGGGGSSYVTGTATTTEGGTGSSAANTSDTDYSGGAGTGGTAGAVNSSGSAGNNGLIVISYKPAIGLVKKGTDAYQITLDENLNLSAMINNQSVSTQITEAWHHIALKYDSNAGGTEELQLYVDGVKEDSADYSAAIATNNSPLKIGEIFNGIIDELTISSSTRSTEWIKTRYNNLSDAGSFVSFAGEAIVASYYETALVVDIPDSATGYMWQVMACDDDGDCSEWDRFNVAAPNFKVDTTQPSAPGALGESSKTSDTIILSYGDQTDEANFLEYKIFYSTSTPVTEADHEHDDSDLDYKNYNSESLTTVTGLDSETTYYFNIWAYDQAGNKASSTITTITTNSAVSSPGVSFYTKGDRILYYRVWDGTDWGAEQSGPTLGSAAGDNIRHIRTLRSDDGGKVGVLAKTWDGTNQEWWATVYRFTADNFATSTQLGAAQTNGINASSTAGCLASLSGKEFFVVTANGSSDGTRAYSWDDAIGWVSEGAGPNPAAVLNSCKFVRRPSTDNYILITFDDDQDVGTSYYYGGSTYANSWTTWVQHSSIEEDADNHFGDAYFDAGNNTRGAITYSNSDTALTAQAKYFLCGNSSINYGTASSTPPNWADDYVHGEFSANPAGSGIAYLAGRDINQDLNIFKVSVATGQVVWSVPTNSDNVSYSDLYDHTNYSEKPFAIIFYKGGKAVVGWNPDSNGVPKFSTINAATNAVSASSTVPGAGANIWTRSRFYKDPNEDEFIAVYQNDDIDYSAVFWNGATDSFYSSSNQAWTDLATGTSAYSANDENISFAYTKFNSAPNAPTSLQQLKLDASTTIANLGWTNEDSVVFKASVYDSDTNEIIKVYLQLLTNSDAFISSTSEPTNACATSTTFSNCTSKVWQVATSTVGDYSTNPYNVSTTIQATSSSLGYKWQAIACDDDGACSAWMVFNATTPNFWIDTTPPTAPGNLTISNVDSDSIRLIFGATSTEDNFSTYKIFYKIGSAGVAESDSEHSDGDLTDIDFNGTTFTDVNGLASSTNYVFNIWVYDLAGNAASATPEVSTTTRALPNIAQTSYLFENDDGVDVNSNSSAVASNTPLSDVYIGERINVRIQIENNGEDIYSNKVYKLQYENQTATSGVWYDIGAATEISHSPGLSGVNGQAITSSKAAVNYYARDNGTWHEDTNLTNVYSLNFSHYTEFVFAIETSHALTGTTYRLRLFNNTDNSALHEYVAYPTISTRSNDDSKYSKSTHGSLPGDTADLNYYFDPWAYSIITADDGNRDAVSANSNYPIFNYATKNSTNTEAISVNWNGQSTVAASVNGIYLQVYRFGGINEWETVATNTTAAANSDFNLSSNLNSLLASYYNGSDWTYWRVYQESGNEILRSDYFNISFSTSTPETNQLHFRWRNNDGSEAVATWREDEDEGDPTGATTPIDKNENIRLRIEVANLGGGEATAYNYGIQYASSSGSCTSGIGAWTDITLNTGNHWAIGTSSDFNDGDTTAGRLDNTEGYNFISGYMVQDSSTTTSAVTLEEQDYTEVEFVIYATNNADTAGTYCFRLTNEAALLTNYSIHPVLTLAGNTNIAPSFSVHPSDNGSATSSPRHYGEDVAFTATAGDPEGHSYYLAVCRTSSITAGNDGPPVCNDGAWCVSGAFASSTEASCNYTVATTSAEEFEWYAYACDKVAGFGVAKCSAVSQGLDTAANNSPFVINRPPSFYSIGVVVDNLDPGGTYTFWATSTENDVLDAADTLRLHVCSANSASFAGCSGTSTICTTWSEAPPNISCDYQTATPTPAGDFTYYAFVYDSHGLVATSSSLSSTYTVNNTPPNMGTLLLNGGQPIIVNIRGAGDKAISAINSSVVDLNGCSDLDSVVGVIYINDDDYTCTQNENDCYRLTSVAAECSIQCTPGSIIASTTCTAQMKYYSFPTDYQINNPMEPYKWMSYMQVYDGVTYSSATSSPVELNTNLALDVNEEWIDFGDKLYAGQNSGADNATTTVYNSGNSPIDSNISGTNLVADASSTIPVKNIQWSLSAGFNWSSGTDLSAGGDNVDIFAPKATSSTDILDEVYWGIGIPPTAAAKTYYGENLFTPILDEDGW